MLKVKDTRTGGYVSFSVLPIGTVYEDFGGHINIKVDHHKTFFKNEDGVWELVDVVNENAIPLEAELIITGRKK